jgi:hypothetical protein
MCESEIGIGCRQSSAVLAGSSLGPSRASKAMAAAHSSAAEELTPQLIATVLWMTPPSRTQTGASHLLSS